jgi:beta-glucanase (GH16 family)
MKSKASSAFWFYHSTKESWTEIDVFEICGTGDQWVKACHTNAHVFRTPENDKHLANPEIWAAPFQLADDYHVYALEWSAKAIKWYVDGKMIRELENTHWQQPLHLNFDSETMPDWFGMPEPKSLPATFSIEYVRSWKPADGPAT